MGCGGLVAGRRTGSGGVAVGHPVCKGSAGMFGTEGQRLIQEVVPHPGREGFVDAVSRIGLPGAMKCQATLVSSLQASIAFEVNSVPEVGLAKARAMSAARSRATRRPEIAVSTTGSQVLLRGIVGHGENPEPPGSGERVVGEIERPAHLRRDPCQKLRPRARRHCRSGRWRSSGGPASAPTACARRALPRGRAAGSSCGSPRGPRARAERARAGCRTSAVRTPAQHKTGAAQIVITGASAGLPGVEPCAADPATTAQRRSRHTGHLLPQDAEGLRLAEVQSLHGLALSGGRTLASVGGAFGGRSSDEAVVFSFP